MKTITGGYVSSFKGFAKTRSFRRLLLFSITLPLLTTITTADARTTTSVSGKPTTATQQLKPVDGVVIRQDVPYLEPGRSEKLDLYLPASRDGDTSSPAVVMIHGGGWVGGNKAGNREYVAGVALARAGYVCASVDYIKTEGQRWPTNLQDCKNGVRFLRKNAAQYQVNPDAIGVIGGSAGGHLALMVAYTSGVADLEPEQPYPGISSQVRACVNMYGITNLLTRHKNANSGAPRGTLTTSTALFTQSRDEAPELWKRASPVTYVTAKSPPTLIIHGSADGTVNREQAQELVAVLKQNGVEHEYIDLPGVGHAFSLDHKSLPRDLRPEVVAFFDKYLKP